jgi:hypothetical protein
MSQEKFESVIDPDLIDEFLTLAGLVDESLRDNVGNGRGVFDRPEMVP